jgi:SAM-dependent methyltransferase
MRESKGHRETYEAGMKFLRELHGHPLVDEVGDYLRGGNWKRVLRSVLLLLRHYYPLRLSLLDKWLMERRIRAHERRAEKLQGKLVKERQRVKDLKKRSQHVASQTQNSPREEQHTRDPEKHDPRPSIGQVDFGNLRRTTPISLKSGFDRGRPIDRYYIENFLARYADDIRERVLEMGDDYYTCRYGGERVEAGDVLHVTEGNPKATIVADLTRAEHIPSDAFNCIVFIQTLQYIYNMRLAIQALYRILKPGGVLLTTFPGISPISRDPWSDSWCWQLTDVSARRLFAEVFPEESVEVEAHGNVLAAISFLHGVAVEEVHREELDYHDPYYQILITLRAVKPNAAP